MELKDKDGTESSEEDKDDWGIMISRFMKNYPSMTLDNILNLSYPQFKALYSNMYNEATFSIVIPYLGSSENDEKSDVKEIRKITKETQETGKDLNIEELGNLVAQMNQGW